MEEKENLTEAEEVEEKTTALTKEEILAKSREENKSGDEREKQQYSIANSLGFSIGLMLAGIVVIISVICTDRLPVEVMFVVAAMQSVQAILIGVKVRRQRKLYLTVGIVECVMSVVFLILWILELCGVAL